MSISGSNSHTYFEIPLRIVSLNAIIYHYFKMKYINFILLPRSCLKKYFTILQTRLSGQKCILVIIIVIIHN